MQLLINIRREVTYEEGLAFALKNKMMFFECSAKTGFNIEEVFAESAKQIARKITEGFYDLTNEVWNSLIICIELWY